MASKLPLPWKSSACHINSNLLILPPIYRKKSMRIIDNRFYHESFRSYVILISRADGIWRSTPMAGFPRSLMACSVYSRAVRLCSTSPTSTTQIGRSAMPPARPSMSNSYLGWCSRWADSVLCRVSEGITRKLKRPSSDSSSLNRASKPLPPLCGRALRLQHQTIYGRDKAPLLCDRVSPSGEQVPGWR